MNLDDFCINRVWGGDIIGRNKNFEKYIMKIEKNYYIFIFLNVNERKYIEIYFKLSVVN